MPHTDRFSLCAHTRTRAQCGPFDSGTILPGEIVRVMVQARFLARKTQTRHNRKKHGTDTRGAGSAPNGTLAQRGQNTCSNRHAHVREAAAHAYGTHTRKHRLSLFMCNRMSAD